MDLRLAIGALFCGNFFLNHKISLVCIFFQLLAIYQMLCLNHLNKLYQTLNSKTLLNSQLWLNLFFVIDFNFCQWLFNIKFFLRYYVSILFSIRIIFVTYLKRLIDLSFFEKKLEFFVQFFVKFCTIELFLFKQMKL